MPATAPRHNQIADAAKALASAARSVARLGYDATDATKRRRAPSTVLRHEDAELNTERRRALVATTRDLRRNFAIAGWAIRRHIDNVATFTFQARTKDRDFNARLESLVNWYTRRQNCDVTGRHNLHRLVRMAEGLRTVDGDCLLLKLNDGRLQLVEGDRLRDPPAEQMPPVDFLGARRTSPAWSQGVKIDPNGRPLAYSIHARTGGAGFEFETTRKAGDCLHYGYFDRADQTRGISPLAPAINTLRDVYEGFDYALAKAKISQLLGLVIYRDSLGGEADADPEAVGGYSVKFGTDPILLDLDPGDKAEFLNASTPPADFRQYCQTMIGVALKALDIPYSFYDESFSTYSGSRQALLQYEQSAAEKRRDVRELLDAILAWRIGLWVRDGVLELPAGAYLGDLRWEWIGAGLPWIDPLKEINADAMAIANGLDSRQRIAKRRGQDYWEIQAELAAEATAGATVSIPQIVVDAQPQDTAQQ